MISWKSSKLAEHNSIIKILLFILVFGLIVGLLSALLGRLIDPVNNAYVQTLIQYQEVALAVYFIFSAIASVLIPLPTLPVDLLFLGIFDTTLVVIVRILGGLLGASINYHLAHRYGRPLLEKLLSKKNYNAVEDLSGKFNWKQFFIITMIPIINTELMAYVGGLGKIGFRKTMFTLLLAIGYRVVFIAFIVYLYT